MGKGSTVAKIRWGPGHRREYKCLGGIMGLEEEELLEMGHWIGDGGGLEIMR